MARTDVSFIFDLDGTLVDSVYPHVMAWQEALQAEQIDISTWRIHRRIGMSGGLATNMLLREVDVAISLELLERLKTRHSEAYGRLVRSVRPLPVGVLSGGYGQDELERAGAIRVYEDPADLLRHIDEVGGRA
jgi:phosphoglycolate phosphatase-like HAD superfamily hydrolase